MMDVNVQSLVIPSDVFDFDAFCGQYSGRGLLVRLRFLARSTTSSALRLTAYTTAIRKLREFKLLDTHLYNDLFAEARERCGDSFDLAYDKAWVDETDKVAQQRLDRLTVELNTYKTNMIKESIRSAHNELGAFHLSRGDLESAMQSFMNTKDYCATARHIAEMCLNVISSAVQLNNFSHVLHFASRAEQTPNFDQDAVALAKVRAASGLAYMRIGRMKEAALKFAECGGELGDCFSEILSSADVARYGLLCGMAALSREELDEKIRSNKKFRELCDLVPAMREAVNQFYVSKYAPFFAFMQSARGDFLADAYTADLFQRLFDLIKARAVLQYTVPYSKLHLGKMATVFGMTEAEVVQKLSELITTAQISARIDLENGVLVKYVDDKRAANFASAEMVGQQLQDNMTLMMRRLELERCRIQVNSSGRSLPSSQPEDSMP